MYVLKTQFAVRHLESANRFNKSDDFAVITVKISYFWIDYIHFLTIQFPNKMYQHETPNKILVKLDKSLSDAHKELTDWKDKLVTAQKYDDAKAFNELNHEIARLMERVSGMLKDRE